MLWKFPQVIYIVHEHKNTQKYIAEFFKVSEIYKNALFHTIRALGTLKYVSCMSLKASSITYELFMVKKYQKENFQEKSTKKRKKKYLKNIQFLKISIHKCF